MNNMKFQTKILNLLIIISTLLVFSKGEIIDNLVFISENENPIKLEKNNYCYCILTSGKSYTLSNGYITESYSFTTYSAPYAWIGDESGNHYIFTNKEYISVTPADKGKINYNPMTMPTGNDLTYPNSDRHIGYIMEYRFLEINIFVQLKKMK